MNDAIAWLEHADQRPFLLWTHLYDAHQPYEPPEAVCFADQQPLRRRDRVRDAQLRRLLDTLDRRGLSRRTVVVVLADHGESLGERGERDHGIFLYDNCHADSVDDPRARCRCDRASPRSRAAIDVMPTILELAGQPARHSDGRSLSPLMRGDRRPSRGLRRVALSAPDRLERAGLAAR
jgi:arylsulfatase A-like enzyme